MSMGIYMMRNKVSSSSICLQMHSTFHYHWHVVAAGCSILIILSLFNVQLDQIVHQFNSANRLSIP